MKSAILFEIKSFGCIQAIPSKNHFDYSWQEKADLRFSENPLERRLDLIKTCRQNTIKLCDVLIDGKYMDDERDLNLKWCGSKNQRVIDVQKSLLNGEIVLWTA